MRIFLDTTVLVASVVREHPHHSRALPVVQRVLSRRDTGFVAAHGLAEMYAVLTTLPISPRVGPDAARRLIVDNVVPHFEIVALSAREYGRLIGSVAERNVLGGAIYDALQLMCAEKASVERIYTFNVAHFRRLAGELAGRVSLP